jgi:hypothetical protein
MNKLLAISRQVNKVKCSLRINSSIKYYKSANKMLFNLNALQQ